MSPDLPQFALLSSVVLRPGEGMAADQDGFLMLRDERDPDHLLLAVLDGAGQRFGGLRPPFEGMTMPPEAMVALRAAAADDADPGAWLGAANRALAERLRGGSPWREMLEMAEAPPAPLGPALAGLGEAGATIRERAMTLLGGLDDLDTRWLRLALPATVASVARLDLWTREVTWAHVGDTAILRAGAAGAERVTPDQMARFDAAVLRAAAAAHAEGRAPTLFEAARLPEVRAIDVRNGLRHNWVDQTGRPLSGEGCGVIDGLGAMEAYIERGRFVLGRDETLVLASDGMLFPLERDDDEPVEMSDARRMWHGALWRCDAGTALEAVDLFLGADPDGSRHPRVKSRDDAVAVLVRLA